VGERWLPRTRGTASTAFGPIVTVLVAGGLLGGLDAYIASSLIVLGYWLAGSAVVALVFWVRYGRVYDSDVAMVSLSGLSVDPPSGDAAGQSAPHVVFWASRIRSQVHSGVRVIAGATGPIWLASEVGSWAREYERRVSQPEVGPPSPPVPPKS